MFSYLRFCLILFALLAFSGILEAEGISYKVDFEGLKDSTALKEIKTISQLTTLKKRLPGSINALRYRAETDIPEILKVLHAHGYYEAAVTVRIEENKKQVKVIVSIDPGPEYTLQEYSIQLYAGSIENPVYCDKVQLENLGIKLGDPILAQDILASEFLLLQLIAECGYPLAEIAKKEMIVDGETKGLRVHFEVQTGPLCRFGPLIMEGQSKVSAVFIKNKLAWKEGDVYDNTLVDRTQKDLMDSGLFGSVFITHQKATGDHCILPMTVEVTENKHRSVNIGASYQTFYGFGLTFGWEHRNIGDMGRRFTFQGDVTKRSQTGSALFIYPDFMRKNQDYICQAQAMHEHVLPYSMRSYSIANRVERRFKKKGRLSVGGRLERLYVTRSVHNGNYVLAEFPVYFRWNSANNLLNPTKGANFEYRMVPTLNFTQSSVVYFAQMFTQSYYLPLSKRHNIVFAQKITLDSILSSNLNDIPVSKRFFGGSEEELRGYKYRSVSPLAPDGKPIGGRSALFYTFETRLRLTETIGLVPFFDMGSVYLKPWPTFNEEWFKSVGLGFRYFTFMGPFRFDVGIPLDRRRHIDPRYRLLVSIGQMF
jgi:translocation and assembly module TamA